MRSSAYDVVIVGTGMGGATLGYALSKPGRSILFVEQGRDLSAADAIRGTAPEAVPGFSTAQQSDLLARAGRNAESLTDGHAGDAFQPTVGIGTGGSSSLYGMVLERRLPHDFEDWPITYADLQPWYEKAEALYRVRGTPDPLRSDEFIGVRSPGPLSSANQELFHHLKRRGLHPYRVHLATEAVPECHLCQGHLCPPNMRCKNDAASTCLFPALTKGDTQLLTRAKVTHVSVTGTRVTAVHIRNEDGTEAKVEAKVIVLAAGALATPQILLASGNLANGSGLVGRRLMRHAIDLFVLAAGPRFSTPVESKELALNDYYACANWLGTVQSFGMAPPVEYLVNQPGPNLWKLLGPAARPIARLFAGAPIVASILEDRPSADNRIALIGGRPHFWYRLPAQDATRRSKFRRRMLQSFARFAPIPVFGTTDRKALGHVCGTTVMGDSPDSSVVDRNNRAYQADNLYVVDASFFPTSGGVNPSLTIAANALRVAAHLEQVL